MSKKKKEKCEHGNSPAYMSGCFHCVSLAMGALQVCQDNGIKEPAELYMLLRRVCDCDSEKLKAILEDVRKEIAAVRGQPIGANQ